ncbi:hypothetical protein BLL41_18730 [Bacillus sp. FMQ74]|uniref:hypothetical protein n=1 Tax=Bacillus sp. FMQ74 TaxID=1913579 RepID=UPI0008FB648E|nr:hypothetical protein [Bacillus sp. FMQ74]OIR59872.1 hypothetical protein BLL41_18730 [Bacillus sp. FMQ74]
MAFTEELDQKIKQAITSKVKGPCDKCGNFGFELLDGTVRLDLQNKPNVIEVGGPSVPTIALACNNCGKIDLYAAKILVPSEF